MTDRYPRAFEDKMIAPLLIIPFVENSFKHGTSKMLSRPWITLQYIIENNTFYFLLTNSKPEEYLNPNREGRYWFGKCAKKAGPALSGKPRDQNDRGTTTLYRIPGNKSWTNIVRLQAKKKQENS